MIKNICNAEKFEKYFGNMICVDIFITEEKLKVFNKIICKSMKNYY